MAVLLRLLFPGLSALSLVATSALAFGAVPGGAFTVTSDYVLRGISQSDGEPALQGEAHWSFAPGWSAGLWASQVRKRPYHDWTELSSYLQWHGALGNDFELGATASHYTYPGEPRPIRYSYDELGLSMAWRDQIYVAASWTPKLNLYSPTEGLASDQQIYTLEASWHRTLARQVDFVAGVGFYSPQGLDYASYGYGNVTLGWHFGHWRTNLSSIWVQDAAHRQYSPGPAGGPLAVTVSWIF